MTSVAVQKQKAKPREDKVDWELVESFKRALEDLKAGRFTEWKPKRAK